MYNKLFNQSSIKRCLVYFQSFVSVLEVELLYQRLHEFLILKFISKLSSIEAVPVKTPLRDV